ncbi:hypothetical protein V8G54_024009 [Vigna mungo]|uniref:Uncharacterized protein n=1 Tax=Vigna mungo TaxID=3915 RepID=A0AAQ3N4V1_VIGMU
MTSKRLNFLVKGTKRRRFEEIEYLASTARKGLRFRIIIHFSFGEHLYIIQEILCIKNSIFDLKQPVSDMWIRELLSLCIISQRMDGMQLGFQLVQQLLIKISCTKEIENLGRS